MSDTLPLQPQAAVAGDPERRFWLLATGTASCVAAVATAIPFVETLEPSERAKAAGGPVEVDIADVPPGGLKVWSGVASPSGSCGARPRCWRPCKVTTPNSSIRCP